MLDTLGGSRYVPDSSGPAQTRTGSSDPFTGMFNAVTFGTLFSAHSLALPFATFLIGSNRYQPGQSDPSWGGSSVGGAADPFTGKSLFISVWFSST